MVVELEGGCRVVGLKDGQPIQRGDLRIWNHFDSALSLRVLELHGAATLQDDDHDEVLYFLDGPQRETGLLVPAGTSMRLSGEMTIVSSLVPAGRAEARPTSVRLGDAEVQKSGDRWYRELIQGQTTQFVGSIPPGRAPDHFHLYEEVMCVLQGRGVMWTGQSWTPIGAGSCIFLPREQPHCMENTGSGELRLLGVFFPAGSPAVRYPA